MYVDQRFGNLRHRGTHSSEALRPGGGTLITLREIDRNLVGEDRRRARKDYCKQKRSVYVFQVTSPGSSPVALRLTFDGF